MKSTEQGSYNVSCSNACTNDRVEPMKAKPREPMEARPREQVGGGHQSAMQLGNLNQSPNLARNGVLCFKSNVEQALSGSKF